MPGRFIVLEGGDGAGKGTALAGLETRLRDQGEDVLVTREPGGTPEGLALRGMLLSDAGAVWHPHAELLLMLAARIQHVERVIRPAIAAGRTVLCDRFVASTYAYQGGGRGLDKSLILSLHRELVGDLWPDLTILLDVDPAIGLARSKARLACDSGVDEGRFEALDLAFHRRVRTAYLALAAARSGEASPHWAIVDASQSLPAVQAVIAGALQGL